MLKPLDLGELARIDEGRLAAAFAAELRRCAADCTDRPGDATARKVNLTVELVPVMGDAGECESVNAIARIKATVPARKSRAYNFLAKPSGQLLYSEHCPANARQRTIHDAADESADDDLQPPTEG